MSRRPVLETVILSDLHLGTPDAKARQATAFLDAHPSRRLILNGDIIDGWALRRGGVWKDSHTAFVRHVLTRIEEGTEVIYVRGNHDDLLERFLPLSLGRLRVVREYVHPTPDGPYLVVHGDGFDLVTTRYPAVAIAGSVAYELLLRLNRLYACWRRFRGLPPFSLSQAAKAKVKSAVNHLGRYESQLRELARQRGCRGVICGHVHTAADRWIDGVHYLNSGDWVESMTAIVESSPGQFQVVSFQDFPGKGADIEYAVPADSPAVCATS
jgi:UDP-2,3-diacylglucosamine pyrophosphatase LpxH